MNISLVGRQVELTDPIKEYISSSIRTLEKFNLDIISANAVASMQERSRGVVIEYTFNLAGQNTIVIKQRDDDLYAAIDIATDRAQKALRRLHDRLKDHQNESLNAAKIESAAAIDVKAAGEKFEDEIVPVEFDLYKPRDIVDVLEALKASNKQFDVFVDNEDKVRVLFKRNDGRFGLF
jgi:putative sigma-54 modulation protein